MIDSIGRYRSVREAERWTALRSLNAHRLGLYSQFEVRERAGIVVGGPTCDLHDSPFRGARIVAQFSGGYRC